MCLLQNPLVAYLPRVEPNTDPLLFRQQAGFRREKSIVDEDRNIDRNIKNFLPI